MSVSSQKSSYQAKCKNEPLGATNGLSGAFLMNITKGMNSATVVFAGDMAVLRIVPDRDWYGYTKRLYAYDVCKLLH